MCIIQLNRLNNKEFKQKVKEFVIKILKKLQNYEDYSEVNMITGDEYYKTYGDGLVMMVAWVRMIFRRLWSKI